MARFYNRAKQDFALNLWLGLPGRKDVSWPNQLWRVGRVCRPAVPGALLPDQIERVSEVSWHPLCAAHTVHFYKRSSGRLCWGLLVKWMTPKIFRFLFLPIWSPFYIFPTFDHSLWILKFQGNRSGARENPVPVYELLAQCRVSACGFVSLDREELGVSKWRSMLFTI